MRAITCPVPAEVLRALYHTEKLTDEEIVTRLGGEATLKRVRSWRHRFGIETIRRTERHEVIPIEGRLRSLLVGSMLGDGRLARRTHATMYVENHAEDQKEYLLWKAVQWGPWVIHEPMPVTWVLKGKVFQGWRFNTAAHASLNGWQEIFYDDKVGPKRLDSRVVDLVDAFALAIWFMDDGTASWWPSITFGMDPASLGIARSILAKFNLYPRWYVHKGNTGDLIFEGEDQAHLFISLVKPHIPECMAYKLDFGFQGPHYQVRKVLTPEVLQDLASKGIPIREMGRILGASDTTIDRYLTDFGIAHPGRGKVGRPPKKG